LFKYGAFLPHPLQVYDVSSIRGGLIPFSESIWYLKLTHTKARVTVSEYWIKNGTFPMLMPTNEGAVGTTLAIICVQKAKHW